MSLTQPAVQAVTELPDPRASCRSWPSSRCTSCTRRSGARRACGGPSSRPWTASGAGASRAPNPPCSGILDRLSAFWPAAPSWQICVLALRCVSSLELLLWWQLMGWRECV